LINKGANLDIQNQNGDTALHFAASKGQWKIINILLASGADKQLINSNGYAAASVAKTTDFGNRIREYSIVPVQKKEKPKSKINKQYYSGTGWVTSGGFIVTNAHVVDSYSSIQLTYIDKSKGSAQVVAIDHANDLAILKGSRKNQFRGIPISIDPPRIGAEVFTIGYPRPDVMGINLKLTDGLISAVSGLRDDPRFIQMTVPIQSGNSGGPLLNTKGEVIGVTTSVLRSKIIGKEVQVSQNVNYAIKSIYVKALLDTLQDVRSIKMLPRKQNSFEELFERIDQSVVLIDVVVVID
jgi:S1-C subfamily serine protease